MNKEVRTYDNPIKELRLMSVGLETKDDTQMLVEGVPIVFEDPATHGDFTEIISQNALDGAIIKDVPLKYNHSDDFMILARQRKTMDLEIRKPIGLYMAARFIDAQNCKDCYAHVKAGNLNKMSFAFTVKRDEWDYETNTRTILEIEKLFDVAIVDEPFYENTIVMIAQRDAEIAKHFRDVRRKKITQEIERKMVLAEVENKMNQ